MKIIYLSPILLIFVGLYAIFAEKILEPHRKNTNDGNPSTSNSMQAPRPITIDQCSISKNCFMHNKYPCFQNSHQKFACEFTLTWQQVLVRNMRYLQVELMAGTGAANSTRTATPKSSYAALGFDTRINSETPAQRNGPIIVCYTTANQQQVRVALGTVKNGKATFYRAFSNAHDPILIIDKRGHFNRTRRTLECSFKILIRSNVGAADAPPSSSTGKKQTAVSSSVFQLDGVKRYIFVLRGDDVNGVTGALGRPIRGVYYTENQVDLSAENVQNFAFSGATRRGPLAKAHAFLMIIAWMVCAASGTLIARYYKDMWARRSRDEKSAKVWFQAHLALQSICVVLTLIGIILIFVHVRHFSRLSSMPAKLHPILGLIIMVLTILNPILGVCRCKPQSSRRPWFNWIHFIVGTCAFILFVPTSLIGLNMPAISNVLHHDKTSQTYSVLNLYRLNVPQWIVVVFVLFQFICELLLELHMCCYHRRNREKYRSYEIEMMERSREQHNQLLAAGVHGTTLDDELYAHKIRPAPSGRLFRNFLIFFHGLVVLILAIVLMWIIY